MSGRSTNSRMHSDSKLQVYRRLRALQRHQWRPGVTTKISASRVQTKARGPMQQTARRPQGRCKLAWPGPGPEAPASLWNSAMMTTLPHLHPSLMRGCSRAVVAVQGRPMRKHCMPVARGCAGSGATSRPFNSKSACRRKGLHCPETCYSCTHMDQGDSEGAGWWG